MTNDLNTNLRCDLLSMTYEELSSYVKEKGLPSFRAAQIFRGLHSGQRLGEITTLSLSLREQLCRECIDRLPTIERKQTSSDGTIKYLFRLCDGEFIESVFMKYNHGNTLCISSQVGCRMGCRFCASTIDGKVRDLYPSEMLGQIICSTLDTGERISNVVMMGIGEPLDNYDNVIRFLHLVNDERGLNIGLRHISLSTCGVVPNIYKLTDEHLPLTLSVSLHASNDEMRSELMPINRKYKIDELMRACVHYFKSSGRRVSFEYTLIAGENDNERTALELASLIKRYFRDTSEPVHVNLILVNPVAERAYTRPAQKNAEAFRASLERQGINATIRRRLGTDIDAACGQLRRTHNSEV
ncbi:MAG: 23S rRNA (adenine(2503)-C(2))-methyltransferase RlmN [Clostridia bacterium]|nr:23S rRNA (adenine(2503)-C(2))-methyltransferase RlmN [Clostridia bacterium]